MNAFAARLQQLEKDPRFQAFASEAPGCISLLSLWVLEIYSADVHETRLLYGWVVPSPMPHPSDRWHFTDPKSSPLGDSGHSTWRFRLARVGLNAVPRVIGAILRKMGEGENLHVACAAAGAPTPHKFGDLRFGPTYALGPTRFLSHASKHAAGGSDSLSLSSPSAVSPVFVASVVRLNKLQLWSIPGESTYPQGADEMARQSLEYLSSETGLSFTVGDSRRVGDFEWIAPSATNAFEQEYVKVEAVREFDSQQRVTVTDVKVSVRAGPLPEHSPIMVRCRLYLGGEVLSDELRPSVVGATPLTFAPPGDIDRILTSIWTISGKDRWVVWFEDEVYLIRQISIGMGIVGLRGTLNTDWTHSMEKAHERIRKRVLAITSIDQTSYEHTTVDSRSELERAEQEAAALARRLFPSRSEARFFPQGWDKAEGPGLLGFVEWFRRLTEDPSATAFVLIDPYFDEVAIKELLARVKGTQAEYVVLTNTQVPSEDDQGKPKSRRERIPEQLEALAAVFARMPLTVLDLQSKGTSESALFHDRYILVYGPDAHLQKGFSLSNSVQGATRKAPLLVTPIPDDVLPQVAAYVDGLKAASPEFVQNAKLETLFSSKLRRQKMTTRRQSLHMLPLASPFFARLLDEPQLSALEPSVLEKELRSRALLVDERYQFTDAARRGLQTFIGHLTAASSPEQFASLWAPFASWRASLQGSDDNCFEQVFREGKADLVRLLVQYLRTAPQHPAPIGTMTLPIAEEAAGLVHLFFAPFEIVLPQAEYLEQLARTDYRSDTLPFREAAKVLLDLSPEQLVSVVNEVVASLSLEIREAVNSPHMIGATHVLSLVLTQLVEGMYPPRGALHAALFDSPIPLLRAVVAQRHMQLEKTDTALQELTALKPGEQLVAIAEMASVLRIQANRSNYQESDETRNARRQVFQRMIELWPGAGSVPLHDATKLVLLVGGPGEGAWALSTTQELLEPLVDSGKLNWDEVAQIWGEVLEKHLLGLAKKEAGSYSFYERDDPELTHVFISALLQASGDTRTAWQKRLRDVVADTIRTLNVPFLHSRDYRAWVAAREQLDWVWTLARLMILKGASSQAEPWQALQAEASAVLERLPLGHNEALRAFVDSVRRTSDKAGTT